MYYLSNTNVNYSYMVIYYLSKGMLRGAAKGHSSTRDCIEEVLEVLQEDAVGALTEQAEFSVSDLIVGRSVRSLPSKDAQDLYMLLGTCVEDALIPSQFMLVLWDSAQPAGCSKSKLRLSVRKLLAMLVLNNLVQESAAGSYTMHDVSFLVYYASYLNICSL